MARADLMRIHIASVFQELIANETYGSVTVQRIVEEAEVNRKTFYYHFYNKSDLVMYIFRAGLATELKRTFPEENLLYDTGVDDDKYRDFPFYTKDAVGSHDKSAFYMALSRYIGANDAYYTKLFKGESWSYLENYLLSIYEPQMKRTILSFFAEYGVTPPAEDVDYLSAYFAHSTVLWVLHRHVTKTHHYTKETKTNLNNLFYDIIHRSVEVQVDRIRSEATPLTSIG